MVRYEKFTKKKFEYELLQLKLSGLILSYSNITEEWAKVLNSPLKEFVYKLSLPIGYKYVVIYSTIDFSTFESRGKGDDALRVGLVWKTKSGVYYKKIGTRYRTGSVFVNLIKSVELAAALARIDNISEYKKISNI